MSWERSRRAAFLEQYRDLQARGLSQRQAANRLDVPRTTLQAWRAWQDRLDACPQVVEFFERVPGLAFLHRVVLAFHVVCVEIGACGIRLVCLWLQLTGLNRFVGASYGTQQQLNRHVEEAMVAYKREETSRLAQEMPPKEITATQDETFTGGLCVVAIEPVSNSILLEHTAEARDQDPWQALMEPALAGLNCRVMQSTSDEAPGLLADVEHHLGAHHSPDLFHVQHALSKAVSVPLATKQRAASAKAVTKAEETLQQAHAYLAMGTKAAAQRGPGSPPPGAAASSLGRVCGRDHGHAYRWRPAACAQGDQVRRTSGLDWWCWHVRWGVSHGDYCGPAGLRRLRPLDFSRCRGTPKHPHRGLGA